MLKNVSTVYYRMVGCSPVLVIWGMVNSYCLVPLMALLHSSLKTPPKPSRCLYMYYDFRVC